MRNGTGTPVMMISGLSGGWCENGEAGGEGKELEEHLHMFGLVGGVGWRRWLLPRSVTQSCSAYSAIRKLCPTQRGASRNLLRTP